MRAFLLSLCALGICCAQVRIPGPGGATTSAPPSSPTYVTSSAKASNTVVGSGPYAYATTFSFTQHHTYWVAYAAIPGVDCSSWTVAANIATGSTALTSIVSLYRASNYACSGQFYILDAPATTTETVTITSTGGPLGTGSVISISIVDMTGITAVDTPSGCSGGATSGTTATCSALTASAAGIGVAMWAGYYGDGTQTITGTGWSAADSTYAGVTGDRPFTITSHKNIASSGTVTPGASIVGATGVNGSIQGAVFR